MCLSVEDYYYRIYRFPPGICISDGAMVFYSITVIVDVLVGIGTYLLFVAFWIIHRVIFLINAYNYFIVLDICYPFEISKKEITADHS